MVEASKGSTAKARTSAPQTGRRHHAAADAAPPPATSAPTATAARSPPRLARDFQRRSLTPHIVRMRPVARVRSATLRPVAAIRVAVFPAAGLGTRFLPATKAFPKEMLPLVDKPLVQYSVQEAKDAGIERLVFVTARGKSALEDHFDIAPELEQVLQARGKTEPLDQVRALSSLIQISSVRQKQALGLGHAVLQARDLVGGEPFAVMLCDDVIDAA